MPKPPLIIFGLDSGCPEKILRWAGDGTLPTLATLLRRGTAAPLSTADTVSIHGTWTSIWSGVPHLEHGYYSGHTLEAGSYRIRRRHSRDVRVDPFWARLRRTARSAVIVDAPEIALVEGLAGSQLLGWGEHSTRGRPVALPETLVDEARAAVGAPITTDERRWNAWWDARNRRRMLTRIERKQALCEHLLRGSLPDLLVVGFGDTHAAGHRFASYGEGASPESARAPFGLGSALLDVYQAIDRTIGELLARFPSSPDVFVVSNSGMRDGYPVRELMHAFCVQLGYLHLRPPATFRERLLERYERGLSERRRRTLEGLLPEHWGKQLGGDGIPARVDWSRTSAFVLPGLHTGYVRINLRGREPQGIVAPGREYEALLDRLEGDFGQLVDASTGAPAVERMVRTSAVRGGGPPERLPDLFVEWRAHTVPERRIVHPSTELIQRRAERERGNFHSREGLAIAAGPSIAARGMVDAVAPTDLAPLFLALLDEAPDAGSDASACNVFLKPRTA